MIAIRLSNVSCYNVICINTCTNYPFRSQKFHCKTYDLHVHFLLQNISYYEKTICADILHYLEMFSLISLCPLICSIQFKVDQS